MVEKSRGNVATKNETRQRMRHEKSGKKKIRRAKVMNIVSEKPEQQEVMPDEGDKDGSNVVTRQTRLERRCAEQLEAAASADSVVAGEGPNKGLFRSPPSKRRRCLSETLVEGEGEDCEDGGRPSTASPDPGRPDGEERCRHGVEIGAEGIHFDGQGQCSDPDTWSDYWGYDSDA